MMETDKLPRVNGIPTRDGVPDLLSEMDDLQELCMGRSLEYIYFLCHNGEIVYVGKTTNLHHRITGHITRHRVFTHVFFFIPSKWTVAQIESALIVKLAPLYNRRKQLIDATEAEADEICNKYLRQS